MTRTTTSRSPAKALQLKANQFRRLRKDVEYYTKEVSITKEKVNKMKQENFEDSDIRYHTNLLNESVMMLNDSMNSLSEVYKGLALYLKDNFSKEITNLVEEDAAQNEESTEESAEQGASVNREVEGDAEVLKELRSINTFIEETMKNYPTILKSPNPFVEAKNQRFLNNASSDDEEV